MVSSVSPCRDGPLLVRLRDRSWLEKPPPSLGRAGPRLTGLTVQRSREQLTGWGVLERATLVQVSPVWAAQFLQFAAGARSLSTAISGQGSR